MVSFHSVSNVPKVKSHPIYLSTPPSEKLDEIDCIPATKASILSSKRKVTQTLEAASPILSTSRFLMVDESGQIMALVDCESVYVVHLWKDSQRPSLLVGKERSEEPLPEDFVENDDGTPKILYF